MFTFHGASFCFRVVTVIDRTFGVAITEHTELPVQQVYRSAGVADGDVP
jgi:hypothetical protein